MFERLKNWFKRLFRKEEPLDTLKRFKELNSTTPSKDGRIYEHITTSQKTDSEIDKMFAETRAKDLARLKGSRDETQKN